MSANLGKFVWFDQMSNDLPGSGAFYRAVIGWDIAPNAMNAQTYSTLSAGGVPVGGLMPIPDDAKATGVKPAWMGYIGVDDVDVYADKVTAAGGTIHRQPTDIPNIGRFAVAADPQGVGFILFKGNTDAVPATDPTKLGNFCWRELHTSDASAAFDFYEKLFGWGRGQAMDMGDEGLYRVFNFDGAMAGGIMNKMAHEPTSYWAYYVAVEAADAAAARVSAAGGKVIAGPLQVPGGQWMVFSSDPQGATFGMLAPKR
jgi:uncharacterized protein